jgi:hypothetical protein
VITILDIDGTLSDFEERSRACGPAPDRLDKPAFEAWLAKIMNREALLADKVTPGMLEIVQALTSGDPAFYLTNRREEFRDVTQAWLAKSGFPFLPLIMRGNSDWSATETYKIREMEQIRARFASTEQLVVLDDDHEGTCAPFYRRMGALHLKITWSIYSADGDKNSSYGAGGSK